MAGSGVGMKDDKLNRFLKAQQNHYAQALFEITNGKKSTHCMWYIFPQLSGLGKSEMAQYYAIKDLKEAEAYLNHPILGKRLIEISKAFLKHASKSAYAILGSPDDMKLHSSMTLFSRVDQADPIFKEILQHFYGDSPDLASIRLLEKPYL